MGEDTKQPARRINVPKFEHEQRIDEQSHTYSLENSKLKIKEVRSLIM